ncbi:MAG: nucleotide exchange factor GrpE [Nitrospinae bacterium]|nr:nucleotide exchange factor GrpE [Nitrospinota bacterium]MBL7019257.1 nucleotide exchange factor GrpE [Nitrospinaceae bacterium]
MTSKEKKPQAPEALEPEILEPDVLDPEEDAPTEEEKKLSPMEELQEQLKKKDAELAEQKNDFLREKADLENFRKRLIKDKADAVQFANERLLKELVQIDDNMDRALNTPNASLESFREGVEMIHKQLTTFLKNQKVEPIEAVGKPFDPSLHEVMTQLESEEHDENTVMQEYSKGYTLNGRILHSAKVVISKKPAIETPTPKEEESVEGAE